MLAAAGVVVLLAVALRALVPLLAALFQYLGLMGAVLPLSSALAMAPMGRIAGSASAVMGTLQFGIGAAVGAALGVVGGASALAMGTMIALAGLSGLACIWACAGPNEDGPASLSRRTSRMRTRSGLPPTDPGRTRRSTGRAARTPGRTPPDPSGRSHRRR
jgi:hypothetical protein